MASAVGGYGSSRAGFGDEPAAAPATSAPFGHGGYRRATPVSFPPPPPAAPSASSFSSIPVLGIPQPPIFGPLRGLLNEAPPGHLFDQQPQRQSVRLSQPDGFTRVPIAGGPGSESVVPFSLFNQMLLRMERLERENEVLLRVVEELNTLVEQHKGVELQVYEHPSIGTSTAKDPTLLPNAQGTEEEDGGVAPPPWRMRK